MLASFMSMAFCPTNAIVTFVGFGGDSPMTCVDCGGIGVRGSRGVLITA